MDECPCCGDDKPVGEKFCAGCTEEHWLSKRQFVEGDK